jgi:mannose-6-phosphate isomerase-like protein (cupin superfamily)
MDTPHESPVAPARKPVVLRPGEGRVYSMGSIAATFKADGTETQDRCSISEWWLEPHSKGPGAHAHEEDDLFYVLDGTMSLLIGEDWIHAERGSFVLVPAGMVHDFENRGAVRAGVLNVSVPGGFEPSMPSIVEWFAANPPGRTNR